MAGRRGKYGWGHVLGAIILGVVFLVAWECFKP